MRSTGGHAGGASDHAKQRAPASKQTQQDQSPRNRRAVMFGFFAALLGYLLLSGRQPAGWGEGLWAFLALLLVPALAGLIVNRKQAGDRPSRQAFFAGMKAAGWAMLFYASITLTVLANRIGRADGGGQAFLAGVLVTVVYTLVAGSVAGLVNVMLVRILTRSGQHGPAS